MIIDIANSDGTTTIENVIKFIFEQKEVVITYESDKKHTLKYQLKDVKKFVVLDY